MNQVDSPYGASPPPPPESVPHSSHIGSAPPATSDNRELYAAAGAAIGISLLTMCVPILGSIAVVVAGVVFGILGLGSGRRGLAIAGIVCSAVWALAIVIFWALYGAVLLAMLGSS